MTQYDWTPKDWPEYFAMIEKRPEMYFGKSSIVRLQFEVQGILSAEDIYAIPEEKRLKGFSFDAFEEWVDNTYNKRHLSIRSYTLAQFIAGHNDPDLPYHVAVMEDTPEAFALWFTWYHEYQEIKNQEK
jgi:hypothetical protein